MQVVPYRLDDTVTADLGTVVCSGVQALARLPVEQLRVDRSVGHRTAAFVSGYPGSPVAGLDTEFARAARLAADLPIVVRPAVNEELGVSAVMGSQFVANRPDARHPGVVGIWFGKAPGLDRASDALRHAVFAGTSPLGGAVAIVGDDPAAKSSTLPSSSDATFIDLHLPILYPSDVADALTLGRHAISLSRASGLWVGLKVVGAVADGTGTVHLDPGRVQPVIPRRDGPDGTPWECRPEGRLLGARSLELEAELRGIRTDLAIDYGVQNDLNQVVVDPPGAWLGVVASGVTFTELMEAFARLGLGRAELRTAGIRVLEMRMPIPFHPGTVRRFADGLAEVMVVEEMNPSLERRVREALPLPGDPLVTGKHDADGRPRFPESGPLTADRILGPLRDALAPRLGSLLVPPRRPRERIPVTVTGSRTPAFCSGCPHNLSTRVPEGSLVGAGIGCHTMALLSDDPRTGEIVCITAMGNEGAPWIGMSEFVDTDHFVQNLGDGTFFHSGQLAIRAAVAAGVNVTFKLLLNGHVSMTGGQLPPGQRELADIATMLLADGVAEVLVTSDDPRRTRRDPLGRRRRLPRGVQVWHRRRLEEAQRHLATVAGVTVLIHDQACAAEVRRARRRGTVPPAAPVVINPRVCEGCGDCVERSSCLSLHPVETPFGRVTRVDTDSCNVDRSCIQGDCPSFMTVRGVTSPAVAAGRPAVPTDIPVPPLDPDRAPVCRVRFVGIGGTGVVTVARILATAAMLDGREVRGLDQTGLSQKAGPVVSDLVIEGVGETEPSGVLRSNTLGEGTADLYLVLDPLVGAGPALAAVDPRATELVGSSSHTPTAFEAHHPDVRPDDPDLVLARVEAACRPGGHWCDSPAIAKNLAGSAAAANLVVLGAAVQRGVLGVSPSAIEEAVRLNGVEVEANLAAFAWGRLGVADPDRVATALAAVASVPPGPVPPESLTPVMAADLAQLAAQGVPEDLRDHIGVLLADLVAHSGRAVAHDVCGEVLATARREQDVLPGRWDLTAAVAVGLHRLTAVKDEYEVARLLVDPAAMAEVHRGLGLAPGSTVRVDRYLHPPVLRAMGLRRKIRCGPWIEPALRVLAKGRWVRVRWMDPFGHTRVRRDERAVLAEYRAMLVGLRDDLTADRHGAAVAAAGLAQEVRGYEDRKLDGIRAVREALRDRTGSELAQDGDHLAEHGHVAAREAHR